MKIRATRGRTERPREALLQPAVGFWHGMRRIGGSLGSPRSGGDGGALEIPPLSCWGSNLGPLSGSGTAAGGQFYWGGSLLKGNGGVQRSPQAVWKSAAEYKGRRGLDCETDGSSRGESRA